jgi:hypothetical protein
LLKVDESQRRTEAFLLDAAGALVRAVGYEGSGEARSLPKAVAASGYEREALLWQRNSLRPLNGPAAPAPAR